MHRDSLWKVMLAVVCLLLFAAIGVAHVVKPDYFLKRSGMRRGGEMLTEWNRLQFQIAGAIFAAMSVYGLYVLLSDYFSR
jgi:hypothetical protein